MELLHETYQFKVGDRFKYFGKTRGQTTISVGEGALEYRYAESVIDSILEPGKIYTIAKFQKTIFSAPEINGIRNDVTVVFNNNTNIWIEELKADKWIMIEAE